MVRAVLHFFVLQNYRVSYGTLSLQSLSYWASCSRLEVTFVFQLWCSQPGLIMLKFFGATCWFCGAPQIIPISIVTWEFFSILLLQFLLSAIVYRLSLLYLGGLRIFQKANYLVMSSLQFLVIIGTFNHFACAKKIRTIIWLYLVCWLIKFWLISPLAC